MKSTANGGASVLDDACAKALREGSFATGLSAAVTDRDGVTWSSTHGLTDAAAERPVTPDTLFQIGSITKGFTCALLLQAHDAGLVDLDHPVVEYLPWFSVRPRHAPITLRHLMTHTAGIVTGTDVSGDAAFEVWSLRDTEASSPPGSWFHYSNVGYKTLGLVLEEIYHRPYHDLLNDQLLIPLGMHASFPAITTAIRSLHAVGYEPLYDDRPPVRGDGLAPATWIETATADGCIAATAVDMTAWLRLLLRREDTSSNTILSDHSLQELLTPVIAHEDDEKYPGSAYGLGMNVGEIDGHRHTWHSGGMIGYHAAIACDLDEGVAAVVLANGRGPWQETVQHLLATTRATRTDNPAPEFTMPPPGETPHPPAEDPPEAWAPIVGHYRNHNPWQSNIRIYARDDQLWVSLSGSSPEPLVPRADGSFRVGADERSPERLGFDTVIGGTATRATYSGCPLYRTFTP